MSDIKLTCRRILDDQAAAERAVDWFIGRSAAFQLTPLPDDEWAFEFKEENLAAFDAMDRFVVTEQAKIVDSDSERMSELFIVWRIYEGEPDGRQGLDAIPKMVGTPFDDPRRAAEQAEDLNDECGDDGSGIKFIVVPYTRVGQTFGDWWKSLPIGSQKHFTPKEFAERGWAAARS